MNKAKLKKFATEARRELLDKVALQARKIGITENKIEQPNAESSDGIIIKGTHLSRKETNQRNRLIKKIEEISYERVMEEAAYTWFNRFIALRFMEVNGYLPSRVRVLSASDGSSEPDMIKEALSLDLDLDLDLVYEMKLNNQEEALFKYLIIAHCNDLNAYLPFMFGNIEDYTEILFPDGLLNTDSFVRKMTDTETFPEEDWQEVEIIGWLYQFYISEEKDRVFKKKGQYDSKDIPAATQLFTPSWIVKYLIQNSVGKKWIETHPKQHHLVDDWEYYISQETNSTQNYSHINDQKSMAIEDIKILDPAMGSGHILVYAFDLLYEIYLENGYTKNEIPRLILEKNLYGLEIDDRAYQLASFSLVMKAIQYDARFLRRIKRDKLNLNVSAIQETNNTPEKTAEILAENTSLKTNEKVEQFFNQYTDAKTYGSLIKPSIKDTRFIKDLATQVTEQALDNLLVTDEFKYITDEVPKLTQQNEILSAEYDVVVTNPPYMSSSSMNSDLKKFVSKEYPKSKSDMFATFMELDHLLKEDALYAAINMHSWMFLSSFEKLRTHLVSSKQIDSMLHLGTRAFEEIGGEVVQTTAFVLRNHLIDNYPSTFVRLVDYNTASLKSDKAKEAIANPEVSYRYTFDQKDFQKIPGQPIAYWASDEIINNFNESDRLVDVITPKQGLATANNERFLRLWWEPEFSRVKFDTKTTEEASSSGYKWVPYNKGGKRRQWYGNYDYIVNWENDGQEIRNFTDANGKLRSRPQNTDYYFKEAITWPLITSGGFSIRYRLPGSIHDVSGMSAFSKDHDKLLYILGVLSTNIANYIFKILNPTINLQVGDFNNFPVISDEAYYDEVIDLVSDAIQISKLDWDSSEVSWDFSVNPIVKIGKKERTAENHNLETSYTTYKDKTNKLFDDLKKIEGNLNRDFIEIYNLHNDVNSEVSDRDITITKIFDEAEDIPEEIKGNQYVLTKSDVIKQFISYAVGCLFGRYSLDEEGLVYAGGEFDGARYETIDVVEDNILPVTPNVYLENDLVDRFIKFVETVYGQDTLAENLSFIAEALGQKQSETVQDTIRRYFVKDFFKDHAKMYSVTGSGKRPIYWKFTSGKENAFNCFIYMHRYNHTTISRIRTDYLHDVQQRLETRKNDLDNTLNSDATRTELNRARKEIKVVDKQLAELKAYDEELRRMADQQIEIDLDDGFKVNYPKFKSLVEKV